MFALTKLPRFLDYLYLHYQRFYQLYTGMLTELFPCSQATDASLAISEDDTTTKEEDEEIYKLWLRFM
jgi:hypothetical protein